MARERATRNAETFGKGVDERVAFLLNEDEHEHEKKGQAGTDDVCLLPTFHSSLVVPFHGRSVAGLLPHEYV